MATVPVGLPAAAALAPRPVLPVAAARTSADVASGLLGLASATGDVRQGLERFVAGIRNG